jgi:hypothetical protein
VLFPKDLPKKAPSLVDVRALIGCIGKMAELLKNAVAGPALTRAIDAAGPGASAADVVRASKAVATASNPEVDEDQVHLQLKKIYLAYTRLTSWMHIGAAQDIDLGLRAALATDYGQFAEDLNVALKGHGLSQPFAATLVTAFSFVSAGKDDTSSSETGKTADTNKASGAGYVEFESLHFFSRPSHRFDVDLAGTIGFRPALTVVVPDQSNAAVALRTAQYQQAFVWSVAAEPNFRCADLSEIGLVATIGETILTSSHTLLENGDNSQVAVTTGANGSDSAFYWELGGRLNIFSDSLDLLHLSKGLLSPMFGIAGGVRRDQRFRGLELPGGPTAQDYRLFLRLSTNAIRLTDPARADKPFVLTFALEYEKPMHDGDGAVPHGTRVLIRGDLNLFKATNGK